MSMNYTLYDLINGEEAVDFIRSDLSKYSVTYIMIYRMLFSTRKNHAPAGENVYMKSTREKALRRRRETKVFCFFSLQFKSVSARVTAEELVILAGLALLCRRKKGRLLFVTFIHAHVLAQLFQLPGPSIFPAPGPRHSGTSRKIGLKQKESPIR